MRRVMTFSYEGDTLAATLDEAAGTTALLIVSGGNEVRAGAHRGMVRLAASLAGSGIPVFRFDRRGVGDSEGENRGYAHSGADIAAAAAAFRAAAPHVARLIAFGNCDAATALALFHKRSACDGLILANPWLGEEADDLPPAAAIRARYAERLSDPASWRRLATGGIRLSLLLKGLRKVLKRPDEQSLACLMAQSIVSAPPITLILASRDNTARAFQSAWQSGHFDEARTRARLVTIDTASHGFARAQDAAALEAAIRDALR